MKTRNYPHISDTNFPDLNTVNAYKYRQEFDYSRYEISTTAHLCTVPWRSDYADVVYFDDEAARDAYFNGIFEDEGVALPTMFRLYDSGSLKIEVPIDVAQKYNYLVIDYGIVTKEGEPVIGELPDGFRRMCYFIEDLNQESVNTTRLTLATDYWQTYVYSMDIDYLQLTRGHAPVAATDVDSYLENPLENCELLTTSDVNYGELQNVKSEEHIVISDGQMLLCLAFTGNTGTESHPWNWDGRTDAQVIYNSQTLSNVQVISTPVENWQTFVDFTDTNYPQFFQTVKAVFLVPEKIVRYAGDAFDFMGVSWRFLKDQGHFKAGEFDITREKFGFDERFADLAKLYTYPYSAIVADDLRGNSTIIKIEETAGKLALQGVINYMFPFLNIQAYHTGIGSDVTGVINFKTSIDNTYTIGGRDYDFSVKWDIPTMALQLTADSDWALNGKISADCAKANAYASAATGKTNADASATTAKTNADASATNAKNCGDASAIAAKTSADASAENSKTCGDASALSAKTSSDASARTGKTNAAESASTAKSNTSRSVDTSTAVTEMANQLAHDLFIYGARENAYSYGQSSIIQNAQEQAGFDNGWTQMISGLTGTAISGGTTASIPGNLAAAVPGLVNNAVTFSQVTSTNRAFINTSQNTNAKTMLLLYGVEPPTNVDGMMIDAIAEYTATGGLKGKELDASTANASAVSTVTGDATNSNAADSYNTSIANNDRSYSTTVANNQRSYDTTTANNQRNFDTSTSNNRRSYDTSMANNERNYLTSTENNARSYDTSLANNQRSYDTTIENANRSWDAAHAQKLISTHPEFGARGGDGDLIVKPMAMRYNVLTQNAGAIRQAGEQFLRYGYNLEMQWKFDSFNVMPKFSYWQASALVIRGGVYAGALDVIKGILINGVTVWRDPSEVGKISIYDNKE